MEQVAIIVAAQPGHDGVRIRSVAERDADQAQPQGPAPGARQRGGNNGRVERPPGRQLQQRRRLGRGEAQVGGPDIHHPLQRPEAGQRPRRRAAHGHHQMHAIGQARDHAPHEFVHARVTDDVIVIQDEDEIGGQFGEFAAEAGHEHGYGRRGRARERREGGVAERRAMGLDGGDQAPQEGLRLIVVLVQREPGVRKRGICQPGPQRGRLAGAGARP